MSNRRTRVRRNQSLAVGAAALALSGITGCTVGREFRAAAGPAVQSGVTQIVNGILDGLFAAIEPEPTTDSGG